MTAGGFTIDFEPVGRRVTLPPGGTLMDAARLAGVGIVSLCGGEGWCESCIVRVEQGKCQPPTEAEKTAFDAMALQQGYRLACQAVPGGDVKIYLSPESLSAPQRLQVEGEEAAPSSDPVVQIVDVALDPPTLDDLQADTLRLRNALAAQDRADIRIDFPMLGEISNILREQGWKARLALLPGRLAAVLPPGSRVLGLAVDIGTTKLAGYLVDLQTGVTIAKGGAMNPQIAYGEDVISRMAYAMQADEKRLALQSCLVQALNTLLEELCESAGVSPPQVIHAVMVGNTAMHHLFAGLPVRQLAAAPYVPAASEAIAFPASRVGLNLASSAMIQLLPNIAGYVGGDHVAVILATRLWESSRPAMAIDIGTNTEISLAVDGRVYSCSCASGPAFEGAHIHDGMRAAPGAIERVQIVGEGMRIATIGDQPAVGLCGSGILDAVAELFKTGLIDKKGAFRGGDERVRRGAQAQEVVIAPASTTAHGRDITISRRDVNEIQLAKAAIRTGIDVLLETASIQAGDVENWIIAGAFGNYINIESAMRIGLFPQAPLERFRQVGNAAGMGAKLALTSVQHLEDARRIARDVHYVELTTHPDFQARFLKAMYL